MFQEDIVVVGAGASGLFFAARAAGRGRQVLVLDPGPKAARKVRVSGGGRCNFTNLELGPQHYFSDNPHFVKSALARFSPWDAVQWLATHGLEYEEKAMGQLFCVQKAGAVVRALQDDCNSAGVRVALGETVLEAKPEGDGFKVRTESGVYRCRVLIVASGGMSWPQLGAGDVGYRIAKAVGLRVTPPRPALAPLICGQWPYAKLAGLSVRARVSCNTVSYEDDVLFTHKGLSGPAVMQLSTHWTKDAPVELDFLPGHDVAELLEQARQKRGKANVKTVLGEFFTSRVALLLSGAVAGKTMGSLGGKQLAALERRIARWSVMPTRVDGWDKAEVTAGGVDTTALSSKTMQATKVPGLYFLGEVMDVTGMLGGYNLHWAWASAHAAAMDM